MIANIFSEKIFGAFVERIVIDTDKSHKQLYFFPGHVKYIFYV